MISIVKDHNKDWRAYWNSSVDGFSAYRNFGELDPLYWTVILVQRASMSKLYCYLLFYTRRIIKKRKKKEAYHNKMYYTTILKNADVILGDSSKYVNLNTMLRRKSWKEKWVSHFTQQKERYLLGWVPPHHECKYNMPKITKITEARIDLRCGYARMGVQGRIDGRIGERNRRMAILAWIVVWYI